MSSVRRTLRYYGDPILRSRAEPVTSFGPELHDLVLGMYECMYRAEGIGLAAPQVGEGLRVFVIDVMEEEDTPRVKRAFVNPVLVEKTGTVTGEEGCLSIPGIRSDVKRASRIVVEAFDEDGKPFRLEAAGLLSRAIQRKLLEGKLKRFQAPTGDKAEAPGAAPSL